MPVESRAATGRLLRVIPDVTWWRVNEKFEYGLCINPAFRDDVGMKSGQSNDNYGRHSADLEMYVRGPKGAVQFKMFTGWDIEDIEGDRLTRKKGWNHGPSGSDLGWHKRLAPDFVGDEWDYITDDCPIIDGRCSYDGSGLNAEAPLAILVRHGHDAVFEYLTSYYRCVFDGEDFPETPYDWKPSSPSDGDAK